MKYILDTNFFRTFFRFYDKDVSPELFENFEKMIKNGDIISVKEVYHELEKQHQNDSEVMQMIGRIKKIFQEPTNEEEVDILFQIYQNRNFQNNISQKNMLNGSPVADAFLVAKAKTSKGTLVTSENFSPNAAKIPNICNEFGVNYIDFKTFLKKIKEYE